MPIAKGWAKNSVNANILRHNSVTTHEDNQYVAFYDEDGFVVLAKRKHGSTNLNLSFDLYQPARRINGFACLHIHQTPAVEPYFRQKIVRQKDEGIKGIVKGEAPFGQEFLKG